MTRVAALFALSVLGAGCGGGGLLPVVVTGPLGEVRLEVQAEQAITEEERVQGLSGYASLADDRGMLLVFPVEGEVCIQNGTVAFAIDAVFLDGSGRVVAVEEGVAAGDGTVRCHAPAAYVLEVAAGVAADVQLGDVASF